jgi:F-type H+-transporting ATPase subunit a
MAAEQGPTAGEYIVHHLGHLQNKKPESVLDFSVFNLDSLFWGILLGMVGTFYLGCAGAVSGGCGNPG